MDEKLTPPQQEDTITFKRSHFYSILVVLAFAVGIFVGYVAWGRGGNGSTAVAVAQQPQGPVVEVPTADTQYKRYDIPTEGSPSLGPANAPITIVEFSDFQCPFCIRFHQDTYQALLAAYPGKIRFVYRNLPLTSIHPMAQSAAVASLCAKDQNAFWQYHDKLFSAQYDLGRDGYVKYATDLGLDVTKFQTCIDGTSHDGDIKKDSDFALNLGVQSTPTFFINGLAVVGAQPLSAFQQVIDKELTGKIP
jgi:protein-disulfide isomerase